MVPVPSRSQGSPQGVRLRSGRAAPGARVTTLTAFAMACIGPLSGAGCLTDFSGPGGEPDPLCGDGAQDPGETCDDGNRTPGDGCDGACQQELGWTCAGWPSVCTPYCGDGLALGDEVCDGWDVRGGTCVDLGFEGGTLTCEPDCSDVSVAHCEGWCGDGLVGGGEACDGGNLGGQDCTNRGYYAGTLACQPDCLAFDESGCRERCGDGVINGPEACDGALLSGRNCLTLGHYGGTLACQPGCLAFDESGCHLVPRILVNEAQFWLVSYLELVNRSEVTVDLEGFVLRISTELDDGTLEEQDLALPAYDLDPGARVVLADVFIGNGGPPVVNGDAIQFDVRFRFWRRPGAITLMTAVGEPTDFLRWGGALVDPPAGTAWTDTPAPLPSFLSNQQAWALSRLPDGTDTDIAGDFCVTAPTEGAPNTEMCEAPTPRGTLLVTEVSTASVNEVELYNPGTGAVDLDGFALEAYDGTGGYWSAILPPIVLPPGAYLKLVGDQASGSPTLSGGIVHMTSPGWATGAPGAFWLSEPMIFQPVDWVQWGPLGLLPVNRYDWADAPQALDPPGAGETLGRRALTDSDQAADWCPQPGTLGGSNGACL